MPREGAHWGPGWSPQEVHIPWPPQVPRCLLRPSLWSSSGPQPGPTRGSQSKLGRGCKEPVGFQPLSPHLAVTGRVLPPKPAHAISSEPRSK